MNKNFNYHLFLKLNINILLLKKKTHNKNFNYYFFLKLNFFCNDIGNNEENNKVENFMEMSEKCFKS